MCSRVAWTRGLRLREPDNFGFANVFAVPILRMLTAFWCVRGTSEVLLRMSGRKVSLREVFHSINCRFTVHEVFVLKWSLCGPKFQFPLSSCLEEMEWKDLECNMWSTRVCCWLFRKMEKKCIWHILRALCSCMFPTKHKVYRFCSQGIYCMMGEEDLS